MFNQYFSRLTSVGLAALTAFSLYSCSDDKTQEEPPVPPEPKTEVSVTLEAGTPTDQSVSFTLTTSEKADRVAWVYAAKDESVPDAETILSSGTVAELGTKEYLIEELTPDTEYIVAAAAAAGDLTSEVATLTLRTNPRAYKKITATSTRGSAYYGNALTHETGTGQYRLFLGTIPFDEAGIAIGEGTLYRLSLHAAPSENPNAAVLAPGTYVSSKDYAEGTFDPEYSTWLSTTSTGMRADEGFIASGEVTVGYTQGVYSITARIITVRGEAVEISWEGAIDWWNMLPGGEAQYARGFYYGKCDSFFSNPDDPNSDYWIIQMADKYPDPSWALAVSFFSEQTDDYKNPRPADGTYTIKMNDTTVPGSILYGVKGSTAYQDSGTFMESAFGNWYMSEGTMTLTISGDQYTIACVMTDAKGHSVEVNYSGQIDIKNNYTPPITRDIDVTFDRVCGGEGRYYGEKEDGIYMYQVCLADGEINEWWNPKPVTTGEEIYFLDMTLFSATKPTDDNFVIPAGTYTFSGDYIDMACDSYSTYVCHWDTEGFKQELYFSEGTVSVEHTEAGYHIVLDGVSEEGNTVRCTYDGAIEMHNSSGKPLSLRRKGSYQLPASLTAGTWMTSGDSQRVNLRENVLR